MGNEHSQIPGIEISEKVIEVSDFWSQHHACIDSSSDVTIFIGDLFVNEPLWKLSTPLKKFSKNIILYRHPSIIKYISSWQKASKFYLAVENVTPLSHLITKMNITEICLGLYSILKALCFLHEKAMVSHNNICLSSIFIAKDGNWKLGGMEFLCSYKDLSCEFLSKSKNYRYNKAIDNNEDTFIKHCTKNLDFIDVYAFCVLVNDVFKNIDEGDVKIFKDFCRNIVHTSEISNRPCLKSILDHAFFRQAFINIYANLIELPLKSEIEKTDFFANLKQELGSFNEDIVASQLGGLLVSRMVLINETARSCLLPHLLVPRKNNEDSLFSEETFKQYIAPKLLRIFSVRDAQIRLILLKYFPCFVNCFSTHELQECLLPELLLGIKDTNNELVCTTLHVLADLVPILGAEIVIGGKRASLFKDNRPKSYANNGSRKNSKVTVKEHIENEIIVPNIDQLSLTSSIVELIQSRNDLPERPRPDGEEGDTSTEELEQSIEEDNNWEDWDNQETSVDVNPIQESASTESPAIESILPSINITKTPSLSKPKKILDITELDIKNQATKVEDENDVDFFQDMEPVIENNKTFLLDIPIETERTIDSKLCAINDGNEDGWGDDWE